MTLQLHVATTNRGKLRDFAQAVMAGNGIALEFLPLPGLDYLPTPDEDQATFEGNARLKAKYYSRHAPGLLVLADDSGLEVDALEGRPGVRSARFAADLGYSSADAKTDTANNEALLLAMAEQTDRVARYRCVLALARDGIVLEIAEGSLEGELLTAPEGDGGFGYDPLFFLPGENATMAQIGPEVRNDVSHRARALRSLAGSLLATALR